MLLVLTMGKKPARGVKHLTLSGNVKENCETAERFILVLRKSWLKAWSLSVLTHATWRLKGFNICYRNPDSLKCLKRHF